MHWGISLSDCLCALCSPHRVVIICLEIQVVFHCSQKVKNYISKDDWTNIITKMRTTFAISSFSEITGEVQFCCWTRKYQPRGCVRWLSFLLWVLLHFSPAVYAFPLSFSPRGSNFPCRPLEGQLVKPPPEPLYSTSVQGLKVPLYSLWVYNTCLCIYELVCADIILYILWMCPTEKKACSFSRQYILLCISSPFSLPAHQIPWLCQWPLGSNSDAQRHPLWQLFLMQLATTVV